MSSSILPPFFLSHHLFSWRYLSTNFVILSHIIIQEKKTYNGKLNIKKRKLAQQ